MITYTVEAINQSGESHGILLTRLACRWKAYDAFRMTGARCSLKLTNGCAQRTRLTGANVGWKSFPSPSRGNILVAIITPEQILFRTTAHQHFNRPVESLFGQIFTRQRVQKQAIASCAG